RHASRSDARGTQPADRPPLDAWDVSRHQASLARTLLNRGTNGKRGHRPPPHELIGQPIGERRMGYVHTETRRGWGLGGSPAGDREGSAQREDSPPGGQPPFGLVEVEAMSQQTSSSTHERYGIARVLQVWELPRSTFYAQRVRRAHPATGRRGRTPILDDAAL